MPWNAERYEQFKTERAAPFEDVFRLIVAKEGMNVVDLGCGTGNLTAELADRLPASEVLGIDASQEMLTRAQEQTRPGLRFELGKLEAVSGQWDLVFSHAAIQWVHDHYSLVPRLFSLVKPGGQLTVQVPSNFGHAAHQQLQRVAEEEPFASALGELPPAPTVLPIDEYAQLLHDQGGQKLTVFEKVYPHLLKEADAIVDWMSGTALVFYFDHLPPELHEPFRERFRRYIRERFPSSPVFYGFRRIIFAASRPL